MNWTLLGNSVLVSSVATLLALAFGFVAALWMSGMGGRWQAVLSAAAVLALALPPFVVANCWLDLLGDNGKWRSWLGFSIYGKPGTISVLALMLWPIALSFAAGAWRQLDPVLLEVEPALSGWAAIRYLLIPMARPALAQAATLILVLAFNNFAIPAILQTKVFPAEAWIDFNTRLDFGRALQLSWPMVLAPLLFLWWLRAQEWAWPALHGPTRPAVWRQRLGPFLFSGCGVVALLLLFLSLALPVMDLIATKRTWTELAPAWAAGRRAAWNSILIAGTVASLGVILGLASWRRRVRALIWLPFLVPGVVLAISFIFLFNRGWSRFLYQNIGILIFALTVRYLAIGWNGVALGVRALDPDARDSARLHGASGWQLARHIYGPLAGRPILAGWYVTYLLCLWDVETQALLTPPGGETISLRIFNLLHYGHNPQVNALCLLVLTLAILPLTLWAAMAALAKGWRALAGGGKNFPKQSWLKSAAVLASIPLWLGCGAEKANTIRPISSKAFRAVQIIGMRGTGAGEFNKPRSVALDPQDNLYVVDMTGRVQKFSSNGVFISFWQMPETEKGKPKGMCLDGDGNVVVVEPHYARVNHFAADGRLVRQWGHAGTNDGQLSFPRAVAVNSKGHLFVSEYGVVERVQEFTALGGKWVRSFGRAGEARGQFNRVEGVAIDSHDRIYLADSCNHRIQIFSADGKFLRAYGRAGTAAGEFGYPHDIQIDARGRQYVCEFGNSRIQVFDANDQFMEVLGRPGAAPGEFNNPWSIALDSAGNLYVADGGNHRVEKFIVRE